MTDFSWFQMINKPALTPPAYIFPVVWTILYTLLAVSLVLYIKNCYWEKKIIPLLVFFIQLAFNLAWSPAFFEMHNMKLAFAIVLIMIVLTIVTIGLFYQTSKLSAVLLLPYLIWIIFAAYLNFGLILLN